MTAMSNLVMRAKPAASPGPLPARRRDPQPVTGKVVRTGLGAGAGLGFGLGLGFGFGLVAVGLGAGWVEGLVPVGDGTGLVPVGDGIGLVPVGDGDGLVPVGDGDGLVPVGDGDGLVPVGDGDGLVPVGDGDGLVPVGDGDGLVPVGDGDGPAQPGTVIVSSSRVTAPLRARARPMMVAPCCTVIELRARMVPTKTEDVLRVAELPTCQKTLQAWAPLARTTELPTSVTSVEAGAWKIQNRVRVTLRVQGQRALDFQRRRGLVDTGNEWPLLDAGGADGALGVRPRRRRYGRLVERGGQVSLGVCRDPVGYVLGTVHDTGGESGYGGARAQAEIPVDDGQASVGDRGPGQDPETAGRPETYRRGRGDCGLAEGKRGYSDGASHQGAGRQPEVAGVPG